MKKQNLFFSFFIALIFFASCGNSLKHKEHTDEGVLIREYYPNKKIKSEGIYLEDDSTKNGWYKQYYENGNKEFEGNYVKGKKNGSFINYSEDGFLESKAEYKNGLSDGKVLWYYKNGEVKSESLWRNDEEYGERKFYYFDGKIEKYTVIDFSGKVHYLIKWDSLGNKINEEGYVFSPRYFCDYTNDSIPVNKEISIQITVAQPPNTKTIINIGDVTKDRKLENLKQYPITSNTVTYKKRYDKIGKYTFVTIGEIRDLENNIVKQDTVFTDIEVK